jgi:hypothetical protein
MNWEELKRFVEKNNYEKYAVFNEDGFDIVIPSLTD